MRTSWRWISGAGIWPCPAVPPGLELTADYGERVYEYGLDLSYQREGDTTLTVHRPRGSGGGDGPDLRGRDLPGI